MAMKSRLRAGRYSNGPASLRGNLTFDALGLREIPYTSPEGDRRKNHARANLATATVIGIAISLAACQTPAVQTRTVEVKIPVAVQPIKPAQVPAVPAPLPPRPSSLSAAADVLASKWCEAVSYFLKADPLLRVSAGQQPNALPTYPECER
jgi:hypothetical protein